ncbi:phage portal protein [Arcanobacterium phocae]|uniref:phage portal protein n=1 Tax=Arcanobacterium phocae TaxID=131112 RepID=UPI001C0ECF09|nr:phage portal protein [Arcanobacterium phocae]
MKIEKALGQLQESVPTRITGVTDAELDQIKTLWKVWASKVKGNLLRSAYYDADIMVKDLFISSPPGVAQKVQAVVGWPAKAVNVLADRTVFEGFVSPDDNATDPFDLNSVLVKNNFELEFNQAVRSAYKHSCSFITVSRPLDRPDEILVLARSADSSAATWDRTRREISSMMSVLESDSEGIPTSMDVFLSYVTLRIVRNGTHWIADRLPNPFGKVMAEPVVFDPDMSRPFGRSRISKPVMSITDNAMRTILRGEVASEFYTVPRMVVLGVESGAFDRGKWQMTMDRWVGFTRDEDGNAPQAQQLPQMTMQPLMDQYRSYAAQFAAETDLPISSLGIVQDNPSSAEAMYAAEKDLITRTRQANRVHANTLRRLSWKIIALRDGLAEVPDEALRLEAKFTNPSFTSPVTAADALSKLSAVFPWLAESEVALEYAGFSRPEITRLLSDKRRTSGAGVIDRLIGGGDGFKSRVGTVHSSEPADRLVDAAGVGDGLGADSGNVG